MTNTTQRYKDTETYSFVRKTLYLCASVFQNRTKLFFYYRLNKKSSAKILKIVFFEVKDIAE